MRSLLIKDGLVVCPRSDIEEKLDILVENGVISKVQKEIKAGRATKLINAKGKIVVPGLIDINTYLREPGREDIGTIESGSKSAAAGGFTSIACMPNTNPVIDSQLGVAYLLAKANQTSLINILPIGALTKSLRGEELSDIYSLVKSGVVAMADFSIMNSLIMRNALEYCAMFNIPVISYCEDRYLSEGGCINEGEVSTLLGFKGIPSVAESIMVQRDIMLTKFTSSKLHIRTISAKDSIEYIKKAKQDKINVSCETSAYHFCLTDRDILHSNYDTNLKMMPPLRTDEDRKAIIAGLRDDTIDAIVSAHSPWLANEKDREFINAPDGVIGLETTLPIIFTKLIEKKHLSLKKAISKITSAPASILNLSSKGSLSSGGIADISIIDPNMEKLITNDFFHSISKNSPFMGKKLKGFAVYTIVDGFVVYDRYKDAFFSRNS